MTKSSFDLINPNKNKLMAPQRQEFILKQNTWILTKTCSCGIQLVEELQYIYIYKYEARAGAAWSRWGWYDYNTKYTATD